MTIAEQLIPRNISLNVPKLPALAASKARRIRYAARPPQEFNIIIATDSYKFSHPFSYPRGLIGMASYIEARTGGADIIVPFGYQATLQKYLRKPITLAQIDEAEAFAAAHGEPFNRPVWEHILNEYKGFLPVLIRAVPEGTPVRSGNALVTIMCTDQYVAENIFWLCSFLETFLLRAVWYPSTIATLDRSIKEEMKHFYELTGADLNFLPFALHDFGGRGVTCHEQAQIGGAAHTVNFSGSDTVEGITYANYWYHAPMAAYSVRATEHSVECSFGLSDEGEIAYIDHQLTVFEGKGVIISMVGDGQNIYRFAKHLCTTFKDRIIDLHERLGMKIVCRPDSGDALDVVPALIRMFADAFGTTTTSKGYYRLYGGIGILQGDGVDHMLIKSLLGKLLIMNFSADCIVFGSGGALLQKVNRDTLRWAQKASAILVIENGEFIWRGIAKDPITDPGKKSKEGVLTLALNTKTGRHETIRIDQGPLDPKYVDLMEDIYDTGEFFNETVLEEVRVRVATSTLA
jgi:nicotinamide phosphoribosyltransferase